MSIEDTIRRSYEAMSRGDAAGYAAAFAEDATLVEPMFPEGLRGREAIQATSEAMLKQLLRRRRLLAAARDRRLTGRRLPDSGCAVGEPAIRDGGG